MSVVERDPVTGYNTTGHDWNGIKELNSPVPRVVIYFIIVTHLAALIWWVLLPTWPLGTTYTKGILGIDQQDQVAADIAKADAARAGWMNQIDTLSYDEIRADPELMLFAKQTAAPMFGENCAACHGREGIGGPGFPRLSDDVWLWGGTAEQIEQTIKVGINSTHDDAHFAQMPAFGRDQILSRDEIDILTAYVLTLDAGVKPDDPSEGAVLYQDNCASCHGETALGLPDTGAPNLTDTDWIYGGDGAAIRQTLVNGRQGHMPTWEARLSPEAIRMLALYVEGLSEDAK